MSHGRMQADLTASRLVGLWFFRVQRGGAQPHVRKFTSDELPWSRQQGFVNYSPIPQDNIKTRPFPVIELIYSARGIEDRPSDIEPSLSTSPPFLKPPPGSEMGKKYQFQAKNGIIYVGYFDTIIETSGEGPRWRFTFANADAAKALVRPERCTETNAPVSNSGPGIGNDDTPRRGIGAGASAAHASVPPPESWPPNSNSRPLETIPQTLRGPVAG
ncbi:hypothetical protein C8Q79DRAFT_637585 [Trametes meyenii]|nr:hypothetical protein C8Q79DRAFT_637585 [Trametes meyenii]